MISNNQKITKRQLSLLNIIYKYRYVTSFQVAKMNDVSIELSRRRLALLNRLGLITRKYDSSYTLNGKPAIFYLTTKGLKALNLPNLNSQMIRQVRSASKLSESFINKCLALLELTIEIKNLSRNDLEVFNSLEIRNLEIFPDNPPDLLLKNTANKFADTAIYYYALTPLFAIRNNIDALVEFYESSDWQDFWHEFPRVVIVCASEKERTSVVRFKNRLLEDLEIDELKIIVISSKTPTNDWLGIK